MAILFLTLISLGIRVWKLNHGLPIAHYSDEGHYIYFALNMGSGDLNPHHFFHPSLYFYFCFLADVLYGLFGFAAGFFKSPAEVWQQYLANPAPFYTLNRFVTAVMGAMTVPLVYGVGKKYFDKKTGLIASFFLGFSFLHIQYSQIANMDVPLTFFVMLAFFFAMRAFEKGNARDFLLSGLIGGFSAATKYQGFETLLWGPLACFLIALREKRNPAAGILDKRCFLFLIFFAVGFTVATPYWILDFSQFKHDFLWNWSYYKSFGKGQLGYEGDWNWLYYLNVLFSYGMGWPLAFAGLAGMGILFSRLSLNNIFLMSFPVIYFAIAGFSKIRTARYLLPLIPFLSLSAAYFTVWLMSKFLKGQHKSKLWALGMASFLIALPSLISTSQYAYIRNSPDTRNLAAEWIRTQIPSGSKVLQSAYAFLPSWPSGPEFEALDPTLLNTRVENLSSLKSLDDYRKEGFRYLILDEWHQGIVFEEGARFPRYSDAVARYHELKGELERSAQLIKTFSPYGRKHVPFDMENVEIPSRSLSQMRRPGPTAWIYKL
ncbi:MAG TPA: glycosyltransferase family 39 protein [bacterium]|nr:glycosyltransferase family 39 protein [bacterium]